MSTITSLIVGYLIKRTKRYKIFVIMGSSIYVLGLMAMIRYRRQGSSRATIIGSQMIVGIGGGMLNGPAQLGVQSSASHQEVAAATAIFLTIMEIGGAVGNAISGAIWTSNIPTKLALYLPPETKDQAGAIFANVSLAATGWPIGNPTREAINRAYQETMTKILVVAVCVAAPCIILSFFMRNYKLDEIDQHVKGVVMGGTQEVADRRPSESFSAPLQRASTSSEYEDTSPESTGDELQAFLNRNFRKKPL